jgi:hypothetical protein
MDGTDPAKLEAALAQLETEQARRRQTKIDSGEAVKGQTIIVVGRDEDAEEALARLPTTTPDGRAIYYDGISVVVTGVPRADPDEAEPVPQLQNSGEISSPLAPEPAASGLITHSQPTPSYVRIVISNGDESGDPGAIVEGWFTIEAGTLVLRDADDKYINSRALLKDDDPAVLARSLLREANGSSDFNRKIVYPGMGLA